MESLGAFAHGPRSRTCRFQRQALVLRCGASKGSEVEGLVNFVEVNWQLNVFVEAAGLRARQEARRARSVRLELNVGRRHFEFSTEFGMVF